MRTIKPTADTAASERYAATAWCLDRCAQRIEDAAQSTTRTARIVNQRWVDYWSHAAASVAQGADILTATGMRWPIEARQS